MNAKYWLLVTVVAVLVSWAGVETKKLCVAKNQLTQSEELRKATEQRVEVAHLKQAQTLVKDK